MGCFETKLTFCRLCSYCLTTNFLFFENHTGSVRFLEMISNSQSNDMKNLELFKDISELLKFPSNYLGALCVISNMCFRTLSFDVSWVS